MNIVIFASLLGLVSAARASDASALDSDAPPADGASGFAKSILRGGLLTTATCPQSFLHNCVDIDLPGSGEGLKCAGLYTMHSQHRCQ